MKAERPLAWLGMALHALVALFVVYAGTAGASLPMAADARERAATLPWPPACSEPVPTARRRAVADHIHIRTASEADAKRQEVIDYIWKGRGLPTSDGLTLRTNVDSPIPATDPRNLAGVDELIVTMDGLASHVYRFRPDTSNGRLALFHAGHSQTLQGAGGGDAIRAFLGEGYEVLAFFMPGYGPNTKLPEPGEGKTVHDYFAGLETPSFTPLEYFVEPVAVALNYVTRRQTYGDIRMMGISGGGWTTTLYAAIDPRIRVSYPVAGSLPLYLRSATCGAPEMGDWEQSGSGIYEIVDYTDLYILGAYGEGRKQIQVLNEFDSCCFWGLRFQSYDHQVRRVVQDLGGGAFRVLLDSSTHGEHRITRWALDQIVASTERAKGTRRPISTRPKARVGYHRATIDPRLDY